MSAQLSMFDPMTLPDLSNVTSSPVSVSGATRFAVRVGTIVVRCGLVAAHASLSARQARALGKLTSGTYGQPGTGSLRMESQKACRSLASRLRAVTDLLASTLFTLTWKEW